jgi:hypothetical protein
MKIVVFWGGGPKPVARKRAVNGYIGYLDNVTF